jgi:hypothetical protein
MSVRFAFLFLALAMLPFAPANAAGGAHVVDDAQVETPGLCHVELWTTAGRGQRIFHAAPACTFASLPDIEFGGFVELASANGEEGMIFGPAIKLALRPVESGIGIGLAASAGVSLGGASVDTASLFLPVTVDVTDRLRFNANAGWAWTRGPLAHEAIYGAQLEYAATSAIGLMAEVFAGSRRGHGYQAGLRWSPGRAAFDIDLLAREDRGEDRARSFTLGLTMRW